MIEQKLEYQCCLCGKHFAGSGNNALPVKNGKCCNKCYTDKVLPARQIQIMVMRKGDKNGSN